MHCLKPEDGVGIMVLEVNYSTASHLASTLQAKQFKEEDSSLSL